MKLVLSDHFIDQALLDKARWFSRLTVEERIAWLDEWTEIILQIPGLDFATAWANKVTMVAGEQEFYVLSKADLIAAKLAAGRQRDLEDAAVLATNSEQSD